MAGISTLGQQIDLPKTYGYRLRLSQYDQPDKTEGDVIRTGNPEFDKELYDAMQTNDLNVVASFLRSSDPQLASQVQGEVLNEMNGRVDKRPDQSALTSKYQPFREQVASRMQGDQFKTGDEGFDLGLKKAMDTNNIQIVQSYLHDSDKRDDLSLRSKVMDEMVYRGDEKMQPWAPAQTASSVGGNPYALQQPQQQQQQPQVNPMQALNMYQQFQGGGGGP